MKQRAVLLEWGSIYVNAGGAVRTRVLQIEWPLHGRYPMLRRELPSCQRAAATSR